MESVHLHLGSSNLKEITEIVGEKKIVVLNHSKINFKKENITFLPFNDLLYVDVIKQKASKAYEEIFSLTKLIIKRDDLLKSLLNEYKRRGIRLSNDEAEKRIVSSIYPSICWIYQLVTVKKMILESFSKIYKIDSFTKFIFKSPNYFRPLDDADFHKRMQFSDLWHKVIFSDLVESYFPEAYPIVFKCEEKQFSETKGLLYEKIKSLKTVILLNFRSIFFFLYKIINRSDYLFINTSFTNEYLKECKRELKITTKKIPSFFLNEFKFNEYLINYQKYRKNEIHDLDNLEPIDKIIIRNLPLSATTFFEYYIKLSRYYKNLSYKKIISSGGLTILTLLRYHLVLFKNKGSTLFITQHGAVGFASPMHEEIEKIFADFYFNWGFKQQKSIVKYESSISCTRPLKKKNNKGLDNKIYIFLTAYPSQLTRINAEFNYNEIALETIPFLLKSLLKKNINNNLIKIRPFPAKKHYLGNDYSVGLHYLANYLKREFPEIQHENKYSGDFIQENASLVIHTYFLGASFFQRLNLDLPFLIFDIFKGEWISQEFMEMYILLKNSKIIFDDHLKLSEHINDIKNEVNNFWYSRKVRFALQKFKKQFTSEDHIYQILDNNNMEKFKN